MLAKTSRGLCENDKTHGNDSSVALRESEKENENVSCIVESDSLQSHGMQPTRLHCPWDSPGKNIGVGCHFLLQENLSNLGIKPAFSVFPALQVDT